jgi:hypothetical protein
MKARFDIYGALRLAAFILLPGFCLSARGIEVGWHDLMSELQLGDGIRLENQQEAKSQGLVTLSGTATNLNTGYQNEIITYAQHTYDMVKTLSVNTSVSLNALMVSGDVDVSFFGKQTFDANDLHFVFTKTRNFGTTVYSPLGFSADFWSQLSLYQNPTNYLQGEALHAALTGALGTHYIAGVERAAMVSVVYTFHYASASVRQQLTVSASGSAFDSASFSGFVSSFFGSTNTSTSMSYQFYSTDPFLSPTNFSFGSSGTIANYQQFTNLVSHLEAYANAMDPANAKVTAYVLNPIETVPGYLSLLGGYIPTPVEAPDYSEFLEAYTALQVWQQRLNSRGTMSWLNAKGQQVISSNALDVANYLVAMKNIAANHFTSGSTLTVPSDVVAYLANLSEIRLPEIYVMDNWEWFNGIGYSHSLIGRVDCGNSDMIAPIPFANVAATNGTTVSTFQLTYTPSNFQNMMTNTYKSGNINTHLRALFASEQWYYLTNGNPDANGFFLMTEPASGASKWTLTIFDPFTQVPIDELPLFATRSGGFVAPSQFSDNVSVSLANSSSPANGVVGMAQPVTMQITNQSPSQCYGTRISFILDGAFDFGGASGSQGYASFDPSTRTVSYTVGPLLGNTSAELTLNFIALQAISESPGTSPTLALSGSLSNSVSSTISLPTITASPPVMGLSQTLGGIQIDWRSDSDRLLPESSPIFGSGASWTPVTNGIVVSGNHRFLAPPVVSRQGYFRLHSE